ncbi:MAG: GGDEF domain-containing protein [Porticoccaceae bacterium]
MSEKFLQFFDPLHQQSADMRADFQRWNRDARVLQIRSIALLTAFLYLIYNYFGGRVAPDEIRHLTPLFHGVLVPILLLLIALMSYHRHLRSWMWVLLMIAPICAIAVNLYLNTRINNFPIYAPELYLGIIWIFAISGLTLRSATFTALVCIVLIAMYTAQASLSPQVLCLHILWIVAAFSFGLANAFLLEKTYKLMFLQQRKLEHSASVDGLTSLWNRYKIEAILEAECAQANRYGTPLALMLLDIDHFKQVNDKYGHTVGDTVLTEFASLLREYTREVDQVGRFGGEEFLILLPHTNIQQAHQAADKLLACINAFHFTAVGHKSASIGVTQYRIGENQLSLIERVDKALYQSKANGRNQVTAL